MLTSCWHTIIFTMACVCAGVQPKPTLTMWCAWHEWTSSSSTPRTTRCVGNMRNVNICGTQKRRSVLQKVAPNCLPALRKQNASLGTCETNTNTSSSDDFPLDRRPPPRVIFSGFQGSHVNSESGYDSDVENILQQKSSLNISSLVAKIIFWYFWETFWTLLN